jgi:hypothetical protein
MFRVHIAMFAINRGVLVRSGTRFYFSYAYNYKAFNPGVQKVFYAWKVYCCNYLQMACLTAYLYILFYWQC